MRNHMNLCQQSFVEKIQKEAYTTEHWAVQALFLHNQQSLNTVEHAGKILLWIHVRELNYSRSLM